LDCLVIGCGLSGSVVARYLADLGIKVTIWERRNHIGGNMFDYVDEYGILVHKYGPHTFHTNNKALIEYIRRFGEWEEYKLTCMAEIDGKTTPTPFNFQTIDDYYPIEEANELKRRIREAFGNRETTTVVELLEHSDEMIRGYAKFLFDKDYSLYTAKQWGVPLSEIDPSVLKRVPLRFSYDVGYFDDKYQVMPKVSYTDFFKKLLDHSNISLVLNVEALERLSISDDGQNLLIDGNIADFPVVYTGALDELFGCTEGKLPYRSLRFEWVHEDIDNFQDAPVVAYPQAENFTRITEYKKLPVQKVNGTTYAVEYSQPYELGIKAEPYYPVLTEKSQRLYKKYRRRADLISNLYHCGRLADFKYYNMDQALERALAVCTNIERSLTR
jgi:UDP-galactopyranose mutase